MRASGGDAMHTFDYVAIGVLIDCIGAGGCAAVSATQDVMGRSSADVRFTPKSGHR